MTKLKLGILGSGFLAEIIAQAWKDGFLNDYELVGICGRNRKTVDELCEKIGCRSCRNVDELLSLGPDFVAEAASESAVKNNAVKILSSGTNMLILSVGAFADGDFYEMVKQTAGASGTRLYVASGAVSGFDTLRTLCLMGEAQAKICTRKGAESLKNTPLFKEELLSGEKEIFSGNAAQAAALLPNKVNVEVAASLAGMGPENTQVSVVSIPGYQGDEHRICAEIPGVSAVVDIYSSSSAIAGWSMVSKLRNIASPIVF